MEQKFKEGDPVQFKAPSTQEACESDHPTPFSVKSSNMEDPYELGRPEEFWKEVVSVMDANGEVFEKVEADDLRAPGEYFIKKYYDGFSERLKRKGEEPLLGSDKAEEIAFVVMDEIEGRGGFDDIWGDLDEDTQEEILYALVNKVRAILQKEG